MAATSTGPRRASVPPSPRLPTFTTARVGLARTLAKKGKIADARREAQAVLDEKAPSNPADWTVKDTRDARQLLESLKGK